MASRKPRTEVDDLIDALAVTAEVTGTPLSKGAAMALAASLSDFPVPVVLRALQRCQRELQGRLTPFAVISRIDDDRPGPNEAWAMIPHDEHGSVVWTQEMAEAYGICAPLLSTGQVIAARMAFIEAYEARVNKARADRIPVRWMPSLGRDPNGRESSLREAVRLGRIPAEQAQKLLPHADFSLSPKLAHIIAPVIGRLTDAGE